MHDSPVVIPVFALDQIQGINNMLCIIRGVGAACDIGPYEFADELDALPLVNQGAPRHHHHQHDFA